MDKTLAWDLGSAQGAQLCDVTSEILWEAAYGLPGSMALLHDGPGLKHTLYFLQFTLLPAPLHHHRSGNDHYFCLT